MTKNNSMDYLPGTTVHAGFPELSNPPVSEVQSQIRVLLGAVQRIARMIEDSQPFTPEGVTRAEIAKESRGVLTSHSLGLELIEAETQKELQS